MSRTSAVLLRTQSDERLVALARSGHERAFETIVRRYRRQLLSACRRMVDDGRAEDVLQQALLAAWGALRRGDDVRDLRAWLFRIVRNAAVSHRRRAGHDGVELVDALSVAASAHEEVERRAVVHETLEAIASLPARQREALLSVAVQGRSQDEVAGDLGVTPMAVRQLVHRARTSLRAAATAVAPLWLVTAAAGAGGEVSESMSARIAGLLASAGGAATLTKAGVVAGVAAVGVATPLVVHKQAPPRTRHAVEPHVREAVTPKPTATATPMRTRPVAATATPSATAPPVPPIVHAPAPGVQRNRVQAVSRPRRAATFKAGERRRHDVDDAQRNDRAGREEDHPRTTPQPVATPHADDEVVNTQGDEGASGKRTAAPERDDGGDDKQSAAKESDPLRAPVPTVTPTPTVPGDGESD